MITKNSSILYRSNFHPSLSPHLLFIVVELEREWSLANCFLTTDTA